METILKSKSYSLPSFFFLKKKISLKGFMQVLQSLNSSDCAFGVSIYKTNKKKSFKMLSNLTSASLAMLLKIIITLWKE